MVIDGTLREETGASGLQGNTLKKNTNPQETFSGKPFAPGRTGYVINAD
jgi:hypothetical protein